MFPFDYFCNRKFVQLFVLLNLNKLLKACLKYLEMVEGAKFNPIDNVSS